MQIHEVFHILKIVLNPTSDHNFWGHVTAQVDMDTFKNRDTKVGWFKKKISQWEKISESSAKKERCIITVLSPHKVMARIKFI